MDELTDEDKLVVARARKIERFLSQPNFVAEQFTGTPGKYVKLEETIRGFQMIINGECDELPESAFYMVGGIDEAFEKRSSRPRASPRRPWPTRTIRPSTWRSSRRRAGVRRRSAHARRAWQEIGVLARHAPLVATLKAGSRPACTSAAESSSSSRPGPASSRSSWTRRWRWSTTPSTCGRSTTSARQQLEAAKAELAKVEAGESTADRWQLEQRIVHAENQLAAAQRADRQAGQQRSRTSTAELSSQTYTQTDSAEPSPASA